MAWKLNLSNIQTLSDVVSDVRCCGVVADLVQIHIAHIWNNPEVVSIVSHKTDDDNIMS